MERREPYMIAVKHRKGSTMRTMLTAVFVSCLMSAPVAAAPDVKQIVGAWSVANGNCRGGEPNSLKTQAECERRASLGGRLDQVGWCYGHKGEVGADYKWHRCSPTSNRPDDFHEPQF